MRRTLLVVAVVTFVLALGLTAYWLLLVQPGQQGEALYHLDVVDLRGTDEATGLLVLSLQGIVNRRSPRLYVLWESMDRHCNPSEEWLEYYASKGWIAYSYATVREVLEKYRNEVSGLVVYDPDFRHSINVATTLAGLYDLLITHPDSVPKLKAMGFTVKWDLRGLWSDKLEAYRWQLENLFPLCNKDVIASAMPVEHPITHRHLPATARPIRDYVIMRRAAALDLIPLPDLPDDYDLLCEYYSQMEPFAVVLGYPFTSALERPHVELLSKHGLVAVLAHVTSVNYSVHCQMPGEVPLRQEHRTSFELDLGKIYIALGASDLALNSMQDRYYGLWDDPGRGSLPVSWWLDGMMCEFCPGIVQYYFETKTANDYFFGAHVGGRIRPSDFPDLEAYLERGKAYLAAYDLRVVAFSNHAKKDEWVYEAYSAVLEDCIGFLHGWVPGSEFGEEGAGSYWLYHGKPWLMTATGIMETAEATARAISAFIERNRERPLFMSVLLGIFRLPSFDLLLEVRRRLDELYPGQVVWVRADELLLAVKAYMDSLAISPCSLAQVLLVKGYQAMPGDPVELLSAEDGRHLVVEAEPQDRLYRVALVADFVVEGPGDVRRLWATFRADFTANVNSSIYFWSFGRSSWVFVGSRLVGPGGWRQEDGIVHNPWEYVAENGTVRIKVVVSAEAPFTTTIDYLGLEPYVLAARKRVPRVNLADESTDLLGPEAEEQTGGWLAEEGPYHSGRCHGSTGDILPVLAPEVSWHGSTRSCPGQEDHLHYCPRLRAWLGDRSRLRSARRGQELPTGRS